MEIMKLIPTGKDYLWGGTRLREEYGKKIDLTPLAETWECSVHPDGPSYVANGIYKGQTLAEVLTAHSEYLGTKVENGELPVLVKFIDAKKDLSVQVHPDDVYAREHEGDNGKTEMWYVKMAGAKKVIVHSHNTHVAGTGKRAVIEKKIHYIIRGFWPLIADYMCACSSEAGNWLFGRKNVEKGKVEILKNGIIGTQYYYNKNTRNEYREKLGWQNNLIVGHVGRFSEQKNHTFLIDVIAEMYKVNPSVRAVLFGIGDLKNDMEQKVEQLGLKSIIKFPGTSPEINKYLQAMDLFLFPSLYEGLPVVGIEAQAAGIWVLASDTISPELKITDKVHWMSLSKPASCWAEKGLELLNQVSERDTALEIKEAGYDIEFTAKRLKDIYES